MSAPLHSAEADPNFTFDPLAYGEEPIRLNDYLGKVVLVVNTASQCGFTDQYQALQVLYEKYRERGFVVIGVPCNDFGGQEPGELKEIATFCELNYGVSFPMTAKYSVKGENAHPFYAWARTKFGFWGAPKWNFHKYLLDRDGKLVDYFYSTTRPNSSRIARAVEKLLEDKQKG